MGLSLGESPITTTSDFMETPTSRIGKGVGVHKRAYAKIRYIGHTMINRMLKKTGVQITITKIESNVQQSTL